jgi:hypothetical protein
MDDLQSAIVKVQNKVSPVQSANVFNADSQHLQIMPLLDIFDTPDDEMNEKVKYIYQYLIDHGGNPKDQIVSIKTKLGYSRGDSDLDRVFKYIKLSERADKDLARYENTRRSIDALTSGR